MTPEQKITHMILIRVEEFNQDPDAIEFAKELSAEAISNKTKPQNVSSYVI